MVTTVITYFDVDTMGLRKCTTTVYGLLNDLVEKDISLKCARLVTLRQFDSFQTIFFEIVTDISIGSRLQNV